MRRRHRLLALAAALALGGGLLAGCGDNLASPPDAAVAEAPRCTAAFSGNFTETSTRLTNCASLSRTSADTALAFSIDAAAIASTFAIAIDLGPAPEPGTYSSAALASWSASALQQVDTSSCLYSAGGAAVPSGSFTLSLASLAATTAHGHLDLQLYVLARPFTDCGQATTEQLSLDF